MCKVAVFLQNLLHTLHHKHLAWTHFLLEKKCDLEEGTHRIMTVLWLKLIFLILASSCIREFLPINLNPGPLPTNFAHAPASRGMRVTSTEYPVLR